MSLSKKLIAYFSHSGNTRTLAEMIQENTGGDLFEIKTVAAYPQAYDDVVAQARKELDKHEKPALSVKLENPDAYEVIFLGFPNWWSTVPMAVLTFLDRHDFSGKIIRPFCTHGGGGLGHSLRDIVNSAPHADILAPLTISGERVRGAGEEIKKWL